MKPEKLNRFQRFILKKLGILQLYNQLNNDSVQNLLYRSDYWINEIINLSETHIGHITITKFPNPGEAVECEITYECAGRTIEQMTTLTLTERCDYE